MDAALHVDRSIPTEAHAEPRDDVAGDAEEPLSPDASLLSPAMAKRLGRLSILGRRAAESRRRGRRKTRRTGLGTEMVDTRAYALGDDPRRIAWSVFARIEKLVVRVAADEAPLRLALAVDTSASMAFGAEDERKAEGGRPSKLRQAARVGAGFAIAAIGGDDRIACAAGSSQAMSALRAASGQVAAARVLALLDGISAGGSTNLRAVAEAAATSAGGRSLVVIVSDLFDPEGALAAVRSVRARGHEAALVEVLHPVEIDPPDLADVDLEDDETGELIAVPPGGARAAYLAALAQHRALIDDGAAELGARVLRVTTAEPFDEVVAGALAAGLLHAGGTR